MSAEDGFEQELVVRLGARAAEVGGSPPLAELREAGRRRAGRQGVVRGVTAVAVLAVCAGVLTQLGGGGSGVGGAVGAAGTGLPSASATRGSGRDEVSPLFACTKGPTSLRTPGLHFHPSLPSSGFPSSGVPSSGFPSSGVPSSGLPSSGLPSSGAPSSGPASSGSPSALSSAQLQRLDLERTAEAVGRMATTSYRDHYFGLCYEDDTSTVHVMRVPGSNLDTAVARMMADRPALKVRFVDAVASLDDQKALAARVDGDRAYWRSKGVEIQFVAVANDGAGLVVDTPQWASAGAEIKARYGPLVVEVR
ncbi:hypothetical protein ACGF12_08325 [Kitasatospora sp. NPDC048296]|uniref:hypothetical protein n=1 Tax=Kitasatospora sp. NPDC048296 TaxID=3364048 RepID=UPI003720B1BB